jgi:predicted molibdopterin-dependent oxidoreductase YjgC
MFAPLPEAERTAVTVTIDGRAHAARAGDSVAAALLAAGVVRFRASAASGAPRGPYCMMGACFECLLTIDGVANRQACQVTVRDGMRIETQSGRRAVPR